LTFRPVPVSASVALAILFLITPLSGPVRPRALQRFPDSGVVVGVSDGDSLRVRFSDGVERRVRLVGADSPEIEAPSETEAWRAFLAKRFAFFHLYHQTVRLEYDATRLDAFGRVLAYVWTGDGTLFNELIIKEGYARAFLKYPFRADYRARFAGAEEKARREERGFWGRGLPSVIPASEARSNLGRLVRVRFACAGIVEKRGFVFLESAGGGFEALIPSDRRHAFPGLDALVGRTLVVSGFLEEFGGRPQIMVTFRRQLAGG
jgi:micrococcal nuclease